MWDSLEARDKTIDYCKNVAKSKTHEIKKKLEKERKIFCRTK